MRPIALAPLVLGAIGACAGREETTRFGYVVAPSVSGDVAPIEPIARPTMDAGPGRYRPLPGEPNAAGCGQTASREVMCRQEEDEIPAAAYPPPFERCPESYAKASPAARFSAAETRRERASDPTACCYVEIRGCRR